MIKLVHRNPTLNEKTRWYCLIDDSNPNWFYATIRGPEGMISSVIHAVPKTEYICEDVPQSKKPLAEEFI